MSKTVHYISLRNIPEYEKEGRRNPPSGQKSDYIIDTLASLGYQVNYVSISESKYNKLYLAKSKKLSDMVTFFLCPNIPGKYRESFTFRWLCHIYSLFHIHNGDILLVYHTNSMRNDLLRKLADKKHMQFVYEVEEIYAYAHEEVDKKVVEDEIEFLQCPDRYLFNSNLLANCVNKRQLPYTLVEGIYKWSRSNVQKYNDGKIHCVYGGIIDNVKGGAIRAVEAAQYLPENYVIHIVGFGDTKLLLDKIEECQASTRCKIQFDGLKKGQDYIDYISRCDIGLSLMTMREDINSTAFPSKIVLYLSCGLSVVACDVRVLRESKLAPLINFYDEDNPRAIANAIQSIKITKTDEAKIKMDEIDTDFKTSLQKLLGE